MQILKAYKFRLEPTEQQAQRLRQLGGCARYVWNHGRAIVKCGVWSRSGGIPV
ncbi:helix-turn-helix domain-containing protein [Aeromonas media]|uniref:helix-turn-helix domain-containing protein n=1 Tax=Aeromonas media TaxID=651 RepID=UPI001F16CD53|nr:helix-turn-helix domain-containing protein [Aeromonas media]